MIIFGIDAGFTAPGFAVVDIQSLPGKILHAECVQTERTSKANFKKLKLRVSEDDARRICVITTRISEIVQEFKPDLVVAEVPTGGARGANAIKGMAFSTAMTVAACNVLRVPLRLITPTQNKKGSTQLDKTAEKDAVFEAVSMTWPEFQWPRMKTREDIDEIQCWAIADALSCVMTYSSMKRHQPAYPP